VLERYPRFAELIEAGADAVAFERLRRAESIGRPLGDDAFLARLEAAARRRFKPRKRGPKPSQPDDGAQGELSGLSA
jgi:putative transposase